MCKLYPPNKTIHQQPPVAIELSSSLPPPATALFRLQPNQPARPATTHPPTNQRHTTKLKSVHIPALFVYAFLINFFCVVVWSVGLVVCGWLTWIGMSRLHWSMQLRKSIHGIVSFEHSDTSGAIAGRGSIARSCFFLFFCLFFLVPCRWAVNFSVHFLRLLVGLQR